MTMAHHIGGRKRRWAPALPVQACQPRPDQPFNRLLPGLADPHPLHHFPDIANP